ncbi:putative cyclin-B3-1 isoform X2 [Raphanus sativus]|uniref:Cyclin-B3-1 isoform X2 n=1 Tax=Raphanus sativus TaxID=3726 RepID=A0A6J0JF27_RAPSA|nr:putative cyclin-B3-1 isoform X2 [Raphanus sativus]
MAFAKAPRLGKDDDLGNRAWTRSFKVYSDNQKTDPDFKVGVAHNKTRIPLRRKSVTISSGATSNINSMKGTSRIRSQNKSSNENSEKYTKVTRKALADLSNVGGNTLRPALSGSSTLKWKGVKCANPQRKLPASNRTSLTDKNTKKDTVSSLDSKKLGQVPASKVSKKALPQLSSARSFTLKSRTSIGSIPSDRTNLSSKNNVRIAKKSIKISNTLSLPLKIQTTVKTSLQNRSPLKKPLVGRSKSQSILSVPSPDEAASALSIPGQVETEGLKEDTQGESSSNVKTDSATKVLDVTAIPKSKRRKSFTSLLVSGSKKNDETAQQEKLPNIDDESNQLEVAEYVDDIYQFYWTAEALNPSLGYYLSTQTKVSPITRGILINWLIEVHSKFDLMHETLYLTMNLLDRYLSQVPVHKNEMQLIGLTALLLASKYEDYWHPRIKDLISISAETYTREQILGMERTMLKELKFRLNEATPYVFMLRFLKAAQSNKKLQQLAFYLIELCLVEYEALKFKPSLLCASAIYVARCTLHMTPVWTALLNCHTHYNVSQMKDCSDMILRFHKAAKTGKLRVTYDKYMKPERSNVAVLKPLDKLPL